MQSAYRYFLKVQVQLPFLCFGLKTSELEKLPILYLTWKSLIERQASIPENLLNKNNTDSFSLEV